MAHIPLEKQIQAFLKNKSRVDNLKMDSGKTYKEVTEEILIHEAKRLRDCIQKSIDKYYAWYTPEFYERTYGLQRALNSNDFNIQFNGDKKFISITFDDNLSHGKGSVLKNGKDGFTPWLIDQGWKNPMATPHFIGYEGFGFIKEAIQDWESDQEYGVYIDKSDWVWE